MSWSCEVKVRNCVDPRNCADSAKEMKKNTLKGGMDAKKESKWDAIHRLTMR